MTLVGHACVEGAGVAIIALRVRIAAGLVNFVLADTTTTGAVTVILGAGEAIVTVNVLDAFAWIVLEGAFVVGATEVHRGTVAVITIVIIDAASRVTVAHELAFLGLHIAGIDGAWITILTICRLGTALSVLCVRTIGAATVDTDVLGALVPVVALKIQVTTLRIVLDMAALAGGQIALVSCAGLEVFAVSGRGAAQWVGFLESAFAIVSGFGARLLVAGVYGALVLVIALFIGEAAVFLRLMNALVVDADVPRADVAVVTAWVLHCKRVAAVVSLGRVLNVFALRPLDAVCDLLEFRILGVALVQGADIVVVALGVEAARVTASVFAVIRTVTTFGINTLRSQAGVIAHTV